MARDRAKHETSSSVREITSECVCVTDLCEREQVRERETTNERERETTSERELKCERAMHERATHES